MARNQTEERNRSLNAVYILQFCLALSRVNELGLCCSPLVANYS